MTTQAHLPVLLHGPRRPSGGRVLEVARAGAKHAARAGREAIGRRGRPIGEIAALEARLACQSLGPTFVKFGQVIASSPAFPDSLVQEFANCLDRVPPEPPSTVRRTIEADLGVLERTFASFDWQPIAAGSIAQVYRASTVDGRDVVVKVQRAGLEDLLRRDLYLMWRTARLAVRLRPSLRAANPVGVVEDFASTLVEELAFTTEAAAMDELRAILAPWPLRIPEVLHDLTSDRVLVMEHLDGVRIADHRGLDELGVDRFRLTDTIFASALYSACRYGVFHGDMHAGNVIVCRDDGRVGLLDFGIVGRLPGALRVQVSELLQCLFEERWDRLAPLCFEMADMTGVDLDAAVADLTEVAERYLSIPLAEMPTAQMAGDILQRCNRYGFVMPSGVLLFFKSLMYLDGLGVRLNPGYEVLSPEQGVSLMPFLAPETGGAPFGETPTYGHAHVLGSPTA